MIYDIEQARKDVKDYYINQEFKRIYKISEAIFESAKKGDSQVTITSYLNYDENMKIINLYKDEGYLVELVNHSNDTSSIIINWYEKVKE